MDPEQLPDWMLGLMPEEGAGDDPTGDDVEWVKCSNCGAPTFLVAPLPESSRPASAMCEPCLEDLWRGCVGLVGRDEPA